MTCNAYCSENATTPLAFVAVGCIAICAAAAEPAAGENLPAGDAGWLAAVSRPAAPVDAAWGEAELTFANPLYVGARPDEKAGEPSADAKSEAETEGQAETKVATKDKHAGHDTTKDLFLPDPQYGKDYSVENQVGIYGSKSAVEPPRPLLEIGRQQYTSGIYDQSSTFLGEKNPLLPGLAIYGDWRTAIASNNNNGKNVSQIATRLNLDVDLKLTGTERIHAFFTPLQKGATKFTRFEFGSGDGNGQFNDELDLNPQTLFFEGDLGSIYTGYSGQEASFDLPFTFGLFPLFLQNGIWANDAILGVAATLPAKNSAALGLANFDITAFAAFDNVNNNGIIGAGQDDNTSLFGVTAFIDAFNGYIETGYAVIDGRDDEEGLFTHFLTAAYTRRYYNTVSNSTRVFANFGDNPNGDSDGFAIISENSLITGLPSTLLPYANFFVGAGNPQPLVDGNGAGILKNVGINFETDALTGYPKLDDSGSNTWGGAIGLQYLFDLDQQLVFEVAMVQPFENDGIGAQDPQYGFGVRYQVPIDRAWLFRADATYQVLESEEDNFGLRAEMRRKF
jgi:hypothetical protein